MIYEYALEPEAVSDRTSCRYFFDQLGVEHGRLIAELPKRNKWLKQAYQSARGRGCGDVELKYIEERLFRSLHGGDKFSIRRERLPYDGEKPWIDNAIDVKDEVRAIVTSSSPPRADAEKIIRATEVDRTLDLWHVQRQVEIPRTAEALVQVVMPLLRSSVHLHLVDPHFDPYAGRWRKSLAAILRTFVQVNQNPARATASIHLDVHDSSRHWEAAVNSLPPFIPIGLGLSIVRWRTGTSGDKMHARYVLTDRGGLQIDYGLDAPGKGTTHVTLLDEDFYRSCWEAFHRDGVKYDLVDQLVVQGEAVD